MVSGKGIPYPQPFFLSYLVSRILARAENEGRISGIKVIRAIPQITHLMYTDDLVIYCKINIQEATKVKKALDLYCLWTGQRINWDKLDVHFSLMYPGM